MANSIIRAFNHSVSNNNGNTLSISSTSNKDFKAVKDVDVNVYSSSQRRYGPNKLCSGILRQKILRVSKTCGHHDTKCTLSQRVSNIMLCEFAHV